MFRVGWAFGSGAVLFPASSGWALRPGTIVQSAPILGLADPMTMSEKARRCSDALLSTFSSDDDAQVESRHDRVPQKTVQIHPSNLDDAKESLKDALTPEGPEVGRDQEGVLELLRILFGERERGPEDLQRLAEIRSWLATEAKRNCCTIRSNSDGEASRSSLLELAACYRIWDLAKEAAHQRSMPRLAAVVSQGVGTSPCQKSANEYLKLHSEHHERGKIPQDFWDIMKLLAGRIREVKPGRGQMNWCSSLGLEMWFRGLPGQRLCESLAQYEKDFNDELAARPYPRHHERLGTDGTGSQSVRECERVEDASFCLLRGWANMDAQGVLAKPAHVLHSQGYSHDHLESVLPFVMMRMLWSLGALRPAESEMQDDDELQRVQSWRRAKQLEAFQTREFIATLLALVSHPAARHTKQELVELVIAILRASVALSDSMPRTMLTKRLVELTCPLWTEERLNASGISGYCKPQWLHAAKALVSRDAHDYRDELHHLYAQLADEGDAAGSELVVRASRLFISVAISPEDLMRSISGIAERVPLPLDSRQQSSERFSGLAHLLRRSSQVLSSTGNNPGSMPLGVYRQHADELRTTISRVNKAQEEATLDVAEQTGMDLVTVSALYSRLLCAGLDGTHTNSCHLTSRCRCTS
jgi:hypothetical protein